tara:strand:- start:38686 stop:38961 length:276 start_codon:yes stop_codon:yes gene_type:complete
MNKAELISAVAERASLSKADATAAVEAVVDTVVDTVSGGGEVKLSGLGSFKSRETAARTGRNPQTGEELQIPASKSPKFTPAKGFKEAVKG